ncbi:MAG TPA: nucleotidyltransferase domain-containing protein [Ignavibacteriaceae bacterium]|nr:nucleotidyltransferase domain-containing protein [Ignavibacteriaceae bacterium]
MAEEKLKETVDYFVEQLINEGLSVSKIILFGSHASGTATDESDIDLVVVSEDFAGKSIFERVRLLNRADAKTIKKFMIPLDVILMSQSDLESETSIIAGYARQGKVVYYS